MENPQIEKLLIVQHKLDILTKIKRELAQIPKEREALKKRIHDENAKIEESRDTLKAMEIKRHNLDIDLKSKEDQLLRYRTQQIAVKKNDEYQALTHEIEQTELEISKIEENEIEALIEIDDAKAEFEIKKAKIESRIKDQEQLIQRLDEREKNLNNSVDDAKSQVKKVRVDVSPEYLREFDRVRKLIKRGVCMAPIEDNKCGGCHLRVSNEVSKNARDVGELTFCDQCSRIVYA